MAFRQPRFLNRQTVLGVTFVFSPHNPMIVAEAEIIYHLEDGQVINVEKLRESAHA